MPWGTVIEEKRRLGITIIKSQVATVMCFWMDWEGNKACLTSPADPLISLLWNTLKEMQRVSMLSTPSPLSSTPNLEGDTPVRSSLHPAPSTSYSSSLPCTKEPAQRGPLPSPPTRQPKYLDVVRCTQPACFPVTAETDLDSSNCNCNHRLLWISNHAKSWDRVLDSGLQGSYILQIIHINIIQGFQLVPGDLTHLTGTCLSSTYYLHIWFMIKGTNIRTGTG